MCIRKEPPEGLEGISSRENGGVGWGMGALRLFET